MRNAIKQCVLILLFILLNTNNSIASKNDAISIKKTFKTNVSVITLPQDDKVIYHHYHYVSAQNNNYDKTIQWDKITHLAWQEIRMHSDGSLSSPNAFLSQKDTLIKTAHENNVKVHLAIMNMGGNLSKFMLNGKLNGKWAIAISNMIKIMEAGNADGISIDFEHAKAMEERALYDDFLLELRNGLDAAGHKNAEITIAVSAALSWVKGFDLNATLNVVDYVFIMGYDFFWSGVNQAGPTGLLRTTGAYARMPWTYHGTWLSMAASIGQYTQNLTAENRKKIIWGAPYYGYRYHTKTDKIGSVTVSDDQVMAKYSGSGKFVSNNPKDHGAIRQWDTLAFNPWFTYKEDGKRYQVYYEDKESIKEKFKVAFQQGLGGIGTLALGIDKGYNGFWEAIEETRSLPIPLGHKSNPIKIPGFPYSDSRDTFNGTWFFNFYHGGSCDGDRPEYGPEYVYEFTLTKTGILTAIVTSNDKFGDLDVHLLSGDKQTNCILQGDKSISKILHPGKYFIVIDSHVDAIGIDHYGLFYLYITFSDKL